MTATAAAFLPKLNGEWFGWFVGKVQDSLGSRALLVADGVTAHQRGLFDPGKLAFVRLPAACTDLPLKAPGRNDV